MGPGWSTTTRNGLLAFAAVWLAVVGVVVVLTDEEDGDACRTLRKRLTAIEDRYGDDPTQTWDRILTVNEDGRERDRLLRDLAAAGCSLPATSTTTTTTTAPSSTRVTIAPIVGTPEEAAAVFIAAWRVGDRDRMISVTDTRDREAERVVDAALIYGRPVGEPDCHYGQSRQYQCDLDMDDGGPRAYLLAGPPGSDVLVFWVGENDGT